MIKAEKGNVAFNGSVAELATDLESIMVGFKRALKCNGVTERRTDEIFADVVRRADMTDEERIREMVHDLLEKVKSEI